MHKDETLHKIESVLDPRLAMHEARLSKASVTRLSLYLRCLEELERNGHSTISSGQLGEALAITDTQVRKDLASLGNLGQPGIGYRLSDLLSAIRRVLGVDRTWRAALVGVGNLARALLRYRGFHERGFTIVALFDNDESKVGKEIEKLKVHSLRDIPKVIAATRAELGVLTVPPEAAQATADALAQAGIRGVLNFAPTRIKPPKGVSVVSVDLAIQLEQLAFEVQLGHLREPG